MNPPLPESALRTAWCTAAPSPYNDDFFSALASVPGMRLSVYYRIDGLSSHPWKDAQRTGSRQAVLGASWRAWLGLWLCIARRQVDVLVIAGWGALGYAVAALIAVARGIPLVLFSDGPDPDRVRTGWRATLRQAWLRWLFDRAAAVFGTGERALRELGRQGVPPFKLRNLPYGFDEARFPCGTPRTAGAPVTIVSSGRLVFRDKANDLALEAFARFARTTAGQEAEYVIVGAGIDGTTLHQRASELGVADRVRFAGWLGQHELSVLYRGADVFLHVARHEPYGVVIAEALCSGMYVVASEGTVAAVELVRPGETGALVAGRDADAFALAIAESVQRVTSPGFSKAAVRAESLRWPLARIVSVAVKTLHEVASKAPPHP